VVGQVLGIDQGWGLFAPAPGKIHGWYTVAGIQFDGKEVDLLRGGGPVAEQKPRLLSATFSNGRWRKLMMNLPGELTMIVQEAREGSQSAAEELRERLPEGVRPQFAEWLREKDPERRAWHESRWRGALNANGIIEVGYPYLLNGYCRYVLQDWNSKHSGLEKIYRVRLCWMKERSVLPGPDGAAEAPPPVKRTYYYELPR
jgi:hypothetical protein